MKKITLGVIIVFCFLFGCSQNNARIYPKSDEAGNLYSAGASGSLSPDSMNRQRMEQAGVKLAELEAQNLYNAELYYNEAQRLYSETGNEFYLGRMKFWREQKTAHADSTIRFPTKWARITAIKCGAVDPGTILNGPLAGTRVGPNMTIRVNVNVPVPPEGMEMTFKIRPDFKHGAGPPPDFDKHVFVVPEKDNEILLQPSNRK